MYINKKQSVNNNNENYQSITITTTTTGICDSLNDFIQTNEMTFCLTTRGYNNNYNNNDSNTNKL